MALFKTWLGTDGVSPLDYSVSANWFSSGAAGIPAGTDLVSILNTTNSISAGLNQSGVTLGSFTINDSFTGRIGNTGLSGSYLQIASPIVNLHFPTASGSPGAGSDMIKLDLGSATASVITVYGSCQSSAETGLEPIRIKGTNANNTLVQEGGTVGIATTAPGEVATLLKASINSGTLNLGAGVTLGTLNQDGGVVNLNCGATTVNLNSGTLTTYGSGALTTVNVAGSATFNSTGTMTTLNVDDGGVADLKLNRAARTVTTINLAKGGTIRGGSHITYSTFNLVKCDIGDVTIEWDGALTLTYVQ